MMGSRSVLMAALVDSVLCLCLLTTGSGEAGAMAKLSSSEVARPVLMLL